MSTSKDGGVAKSRRTASRRKCSTAESRKINRIGVRFFNEDADFGLRYLYSSGMLGEGAESVATWLLKEEGLGRAAIGEYLGNPKAFNLAVLEHYVCIQHLHEKPFVQSMREFLSNFRIPGEAQKIERILEVFARHYTTQFPATLGSPSQESVGSSGQSKGVPRPGVVPSSADTAHILSYSILMLNTDLHNSSVKQHMARDAFVRNNRGIDHGKDLPVDTLESIYDDVSRQEFQAKPDHMDAVQDVQKRIRGLDRQLAAPHRRFVMKISGCAVADIKKSQPATAHQRTLFLFNDLLVVTRKSWTGEHVVKASITLQQANVEPFSTDLYPLGVEVVSRFHREKLLVFNCEERFGHRKFVRQLREVISEAISIERIGGMDGQEMPQLDKTSRSGSSFPWLTRRKTSCDMSLGNSEKVQKAPLGDVHSNFSDRSPKRSPELEKHNSENSNDKNNRRTRSASSQENSQYSVSDPSITTEANMSQLSDAYTMAISRQFSRTFTEDIDLDASISSRKASLSSAACSVRRHSMDHGMRRQTSPLCQTKSVNSPTGGMFATGLSMIPTRICAVARSNSAVRCASFSTSRSFPDVCQLDDGHRASLPNAFDSIADSHLMSLSPQHCLSPREPLSLPEDSTDSCDLLASHADGHGETTNNPACDLPASHADGQGETTNNPACDLLASHADGHGDATNNPAVKLDGKVVKMLSKTELAAGDVLPPPSRTSVRAPRRSISFGNQHSLSQASAEYTPAADTDSPPLLSALVLEGATTTSHRVMRRMAFRGRPSSDWRRDELLLATDCVTRPARGRQSDC